MGYTHYWKSKKPVELNKDQKILIEQVLYEHRDILEVEKQDGYLLFLNGIDEYAHETFAVTEGKAIDFEFCKTARKPYDIAVCKLLLILSLSEGFEFSSDGVYSNRDDDEKVRFDGDWEPAMEWFKEQCYDPMAQVMKGR